MTPIAHASSSTTHRSPLTMWLMAGMMLFAVLVNVAAQAQVSPFRSSSQVHALQQTPALVSTARASVALPAALPDDDTQPPHLVAILPPPHIRLAWHLIAFLCALGVCLPRQYLTFSLPRLGGWREHNLQYRFIHSR